MKVVSNTTPIISLSAIEQLSLLPKLFGKIYVPKAVYEEIKAKDAFGYQEINFCRSLFSFVRPHIQKGTLNATKLYCQIS